MDCLINLVNGDYLQKDGSNLVENFVVDTSAVAMVNDSINTKKYHGIVKARVIDYMNIQYDNPDHRGNIIAWLFCDLKTK